MLASSYTDKTQGVDTPQKGKGVLPTALTVKDLVPWSEFSGGNLCAVFPSHPDAAKAVADASSSPLPSSTSPPSAHVVADILDSPDHEDDGLKEKEGLVSHQSDPLSASLLNDERKNQLKETAEGEKKKGEVITFSYHESVADRMNPIVRESSPFSVNQDINRRVYLW